MPASQTLTVPQPLNAQADNLLIRPMHEADLNAVFELERRAHQHPWSLGILQDCLRAGYVCWVFAQNERVFGYGILTVAVGEAHLLNLCVDPEQQGKGFGKRMLRHLLQQARRHHAETVFLEVRPSNPNAHALYLNAGFQQVGLRKNYYPSDTGREDALILALPLTENED